MKLGEICLLTNDVVRLANFYKTLLGIENNSDDSVHQFIIAEETMLSIHNDGTIKNNDNRNICLAFTCEDVDKEFERLKKLDGALEVQIIEEPETQPWGARNMSFYDPDGNIVYLRSIVNNGK